MGETSPSSLGTHHGDRMWRKEIEMVFTVIARTENREVQMLSLWNSTELQHLRMRNAIIACGPLEESGVVKGALLIIDLPSRADMDRLLDSLPYFRVGHFTTVEVLEGGDE